MARTHRTPFEKRSRSGRNCGAHGTCDYCTSNRTVQARRAEQAAEDAEAEAQVEATFGTCGDCPDCGSLSPWRCGCNEPEVDFDGADDGYERWLEKQAERMAERNRADYRADLLTDEEYDAVRVWERKQQLDAEGLLVDPLDHECDCECEDCDRSCPQCEGDAYPIGALGLMRHYRCRRCGWTFASPIDVDPADLA